MTTSNSSQGAIPQDATPQDATPPDPTRPGPTPPGDASVLDNMAWYALAGPQADLAQWSSNGCAVRYERRISPICATERTDAEAWEGLREIAGGRGFISLFRNRVSNPPAYWEEVFREQISQYLLTEVRSESTPGGGLPIGPLGPEDAEEMVSLARLTEPGPFAIETHRTGQYHGLRRNGRLIAMAGERMRVDGYGEVSAVCVHPEAQRQGLGAALTMAVAAAIVERGDQAMLHVRDGNDAAHALYRKLGFELRTMITVGVFKLDRG